MAQSLFENYKNGLTNRYVFKVSILHMFQVACSIFQKGFSYNFLFLTWCLAGGILRSLGIRNAVNLLAVDSSSICQNVLVIICCPYCLLTACNLLLLNSKCLLIFCLCVINKICSTQERIRSACSYIYLYNCISLSVIVCFAIF